MGRRHRPDSPMATEWQREPTSTPTRSCEDTGFSMDRSFSKQDRRIILRSRLPAEPQSLAIGTIPVDPSDDAGDGGGNSKGVSSASRATDPNSHTPVGFKLAAVHRTRHLRFQENHCHRTGYVDNSPPRVLAHPHCATTAYSSRNSMVDPTRTLGHSRLVRHSSPIFNVQSYAKLRVATKSSRRKRPSLMAPA